MVSFQNRLCQMLIRRCLPLLPRCVSATLGRMTGRKGINGELFSVGSGEPGGKQRQGLMRTRFWICLYVPRYGLPGIAPAGRGVQAGIRGLSPCEFLIGLATRFIGFFSQFVQAVEKVLPWSDE